MLDELASDPSIQTTIPEKIIEYRQLTNIISNERNMLAERFEQGIGDIFSAHTAMRAELFERLAGGAHLYLCGLKGMQPGIEAALEAAAVARGLDFKTWLKALRKEKRYHVEVY